MNKLIYLILLFSITTHAYPTAKVAHQKAIKLAKVLDKSRRNDFINSVDESIDANIESGRFHVNIIVRFDDAITKQFVQEQVTLLKNNGYKVLETVGIDTEILNISWE